MYIPILTCIYTHIHIPIHTYTYMYISTYIHIYISTYIHIYIYIYTHIRKRLLCIHVYIYTYIHKYTSAVSPHRRSRVEVEFSVVASSLKISSIATMHTPHRRGSPPAVFAFFAFAYERNLKKWGKNEKIEKISLQQPLKKHATPQGVSRCGLHFLAFAYIYIYIYVYIYVYIYIYIYIYLSIYLSIYVYIYMYMFMYMYTYMYTYILYRLYICLPLWASSAPGF
jgi:hypothetical protein